MNAHLLTELTVFVLSVFVGIEVISKVPTTLHTPLMSATNAIHGIVLVGALVVAGTWHAPLGPWVTPSPNGCCACFGRDRRRHRKRPTALVARPR